MQLAPTTMKISILGAGAIGTAVAHDLCRHDAVARVQVCETRPATLREMRERPPHPHLRAFEADARDTQTLAPILDGSAVVVSCVDPQHNAALAALALNLGAHFVELGSPDAVRAEQESLTTRAQQTQRWVISGAGLAPGLVGALVLRGLRSVEAPTAARVRVGDVPTDPTTPFNYRLAHSAEKLLDDYTNPATVLRDGVLEEREPLSGLERLRFEGFGEMEAFYTGGGLSALVRALEGRLERLDAKTVRYAGHADQMRFLLDLGLADRTTLDIRTHLTYRDVLLRRLRQRLGGAYRDAVLVRVEVEGVRDGERGTLVAEMVDHYDEASGLSAMQRCTAFPASVAALMLGAGEVPGGGVGDAETTLPLGLFLAALAERGIAVSEMWHPHAVAQAA